MYVVEEFVCWVHLAYEKFPFRIKQRNKQTNKQTKTQEFHSL